MRTQIITAKDAAEMIQSGSTLCSQGMGGNDVAEELLLSLEERFLKTGQPRQLSWIHSSGQGDKNIRGLNHIAHEGLLAWIVGGHFGPAPKYRS